MKTKGQISSIREQGLARLRESQREVSFNSEPSFTRHTDTCSEKNDFDTKETREREKIRMNTEEVLADLSTTDAATASVNMEGSGTEASPYLIRTVTNLYDIPNHLSSHYKLMNDLDLENVVRSPLPDFRGNFDGNGYSINNLNVQGNKNVGLFSTISYATIKNLTLKAATIIAPATCGTLCGISTDSSIHNCRTIEGVVTKSAGNAVAAGGLIGYAIGGSIVQCFVSSNITSNISSYNTIGGIIGQAEKVSVRQCIAICELSGGVISWWNYRTCRLFGKITKLLFNRKNRRE